MKKKKRPGPGVSPSSHFPRAHLWKWKDDLPSDEASLVSFEEEQETGKVKQPPPKSPPRNPTTTGAADAPEPASTASSASDLQGVQTKAKEEEEEEEEEAEAAASEVFELTSQGPVAGTLPTRPGPLEQRRRSSLLIQTVGKHQRRRSSNIVSGRRRSSVAGSSYLDKHPVNEDHQDRLLNPRSEFLESNVQERQDLCFGPEAPSEFRALDPDGHYAQHSSVLDFRCFYLQHVRTSGVLGVPETLQLVQAKSLAKTDDNNHATEAMTLQHYGMGNVRAQALMKTWTHASFPLSKFRALNLSQNRLTWKSLEALDGSSFVDVDLSSNRLGKRGMDALLRGSSRIEPGRSHLRSLSLNACQLGDLGLRVLCQALTEKEEGMVCHLVKLSIQSNDITSHGAQFLSRMLTQNVMLTSLDVSWNAIRGTGAIELAQALLLNSNLKYLNLGYNGLGTTGTEELLGKYIATTKSLVQLILTSNQFTAKAMAVLLSNLPHLPNSEPALSDSTTTSSSSASLQCLHLDQNGDCMTFPMTSTSSLFHLTPPGKKLQRTTTTTKSPRSKRDMKSSSMWTKPAPVYIFTRTLEEHLYETKLSWKSRSWCFGCEHWRKWKFIYTPGTSGPMGNQITLRIWPQGDVHPHVTSTNQYLMEWDDKEVKSKIVYSISIMIPSSKVHYSFEVDGMSVWAADHDYCLNKHQHQHHQSLSPSPSAHHLHPSRSNSALTTHDLQFINVLQPENLTKETETALSAEHHDESHATLPVVGEDTRRHGLLNLSSSMSSPAAHHQNQSSGHSIFHTLQGPATYLTVALPFDWQELVDCPAFRHTWFFEDSGASPQISDFEEASPPTEDQSRAQPQPPTKVDSDDAALLRPLSEDTLEQVFDLMCQYYFLFHEIYRYGIAMFDSTEACAFTLEVWTEIWKCCLQGDLFKGSTASLMSFAQVYEAVYENLVSPEDDEAPKRTSIALSEMIRGMFDVLYQFFWHPENRLVVMKRSHDKDCPGTFAQLIQEFIETILIVYVPRDSPFVLRSRIHSHGATLIINTYRPCLEEIFRSVCQKATSREEEISGSEDSEDEEEEEEEEITMVQFESIVMQCSDSLELSRQDIFLAFVCSLDYSVHYMYPVESMRMSFSEFVEALGRLSLYLSDKWCQQPSMSKRESFMRVKHAHSHNRHHNVWHFAPLPWKSFQAAHQTNNIDIAICISPMFHLLFQSFKFQLMRVGMYHQSTTDGEEEEEEVEDAPNHFAISHDAQDQTELKSFEANHELEQDQTRFESKEHERMSQFVLYWKKELHLKSKVSNRSSLKRLQKRATSRRSSSASFKGLSSSSSKSRILHQHTSATLDLHKT